jgi:basic membrane protein A
MKHNQKLLVAIFTAAVLMVGLVMTHGMTQAALKGKVAIVSDVGGRGDLSFNDMGFKGTDKAAADFGLEMVGIQSATAADYLPNVRNAADRNRSISLLLSDFCLLTRLPLPPRSFLTKNS